jgi:hypothetical protein
MSKKDKQMTSPVDNVVDLPANPPASDMAPVQEKMHEQDRMLLEVAKSRKETAMAQAREAAAKNETAELTYKYIVLQLYMKYGLTAADAISENGDIVRGGAIQQAQGK